jgi:D-alanyl-D-alanine dipeptidase
MKLKFVDLGKFGFVIEPRYYFWGWSDTPTVLARASVAHALVKARKFLPKGYTFKVWDCQRPRKVQLRMIASFRKRLAIAHPKLREDELEKLLYRFASRPKLIVTRLDHHRNGGAIDLTVVDSQGRELWMGTDHDDLTSVAALDYFEKLAPKSAIDREAQKNRRLLKKVMLKAGFGSYAPEWWHWDFDK